MLCNGNRFMPRMRSSMRKPRPSLAGRRRSHFTQLCTQSAASAGLGRRLGRRAEHARSTPASSASAWQAESEAICRELESELQTLRIQVPTRKHTTSNIIHGRLRRILILMWAAYNHRMQRTCNIQHALPLVAYSILPGAQLEEERQLLRVALEARLPAILEQAKIGRKQATSPTHSCHCAAAINYRRVP